MSTRPARTRRSRGGPAGGRRLRGWHGGAGNLVNVGLAQPGPPASSLRLRDEPRLVPRGHHSASPAPGAWWEQSPASQEWQPHGALCTTLQVYDGRSLVCLRLLPSWVWASEIASWDVYRSPHLTDDECGDVWWPVRSLLVGHGAGLPIRAPDPRWFCSVHDSTPTDWSVFIKVCDPARFCPQSQASPSSWRPPERGPGGGSPSRQRGDAPSLSRQISRSSAGCRERTVLFVFGPIARNRWVNIIPVKEWGHEKG